MQRFETTYVGIVNLLQECLDLFTFTAVEGVNDFGLQSYRQVLRRWTGFGFPHFLASSLGTHLHKSQGPSHLRWALEKMVRSRRLELPRAHCPQRPQRCASTSSATTATTLRHRYRLPQYFKSILDRDSKPNRQGQAFDEANAKHGCTPPFLTRYAPFARR